jgi:uncharacterized membrane protein YdfJ with MMPL/SSD domain
MTEALARTCARHPWGTIAAWVGAIVLAIGLVATLLPGSLTSDGQVTNNPESLRAGDLLAQRVLPQEGFSELVVVRSEELTASDPGFRSEIRRLAAVARSKEAVSAASLYYQTRDPSLVSPDRHALLVPVRTDDVERLIELVQQENGRGGFQVALTGNDTSDHDFNQLSQHDLEAGELRFGLPAALIVLVLVFGALVAAALPLVLALVSIVVALGLTAIVAQGYDALSIFVVNMLTGMGLALGIDYALFVTSRFREERAHGKEKPDAIRTVGATASRSVLFSGTAFILAMLGLLLVESTIMRSLAIGAILVGAVSVVAALTLMPAVLSLVGDGINRLRVPRLGREIDRESAQESRFWTWVVTRVIRRPALSLTAGVVLLLAAASPLLGMNIGAAGISTLPDSLVSKQGFLALERSFPAAGADPAQVVIAGNVSSPEVRTGIARLRRDLAGDRDFGPPTLRSEASRGIALLSVPVAADALSDRAVDAVKRLRADYIPPAFDGSGAEVLVGGETAENIDYFTVMRDWLPRVLVFVLGLSFLLLTLAFRSIVISATAIAFNLLSVGATYGLLVLVFQHGVGSGLLGFQQIDKIEAWVPLFLFAVLFGLSMDYQVFLLSRIHERWRRTGDTTDAIVFGIGSTARVITGAALIIVAVFAGFAAGDLVMFQQMGFGIAVALLIDATLVRSVLVPAAMKLLGDYNWYLPRWLEWLPHLEIERGHEPA